MNAAVVMSDANSLVDETKVSRKEGGEVLLLMTIPHEVRLEK